MTNLYKEFIDDIKSKNIINEEELKIAFVTLFYKITNVEIKKFERKTTTGRTDAIFYNSIIEFKSPGILKNDSAFIKAYKQINRYQNKNYKQLFLFDGIFIYDITRNIKHAISESNLKLFIFLLMDEKRALNLSRENIEIELSPFKNKNILNLLYKEAKTIYSDPEIDVWKKLFAVVSPSGEKTYLSTSKKREINDIFKKDNIEEVDFNIALFTLHTYFSIIVKNILIQNLFEQEVLSSGEKPSSNSELENAKFLLENKIYNLFEKDIFSWYIKGSKELNNIILMFRNKLDDFKSISLMFLNDDFFNNVYEVVIPHSIRKSLGEYYTPPKIARDILEFGKIDFSKRIMDPACGSGTFLVQIVEEKIKRKMINKKEIKISEILSDIAGIDINPVAIIAAKANIMIRLMKFRKNNEPIFIPIFIGDSTIINKKINKEIWDKKEIKFENKNKITCYAAEFIQFKNNKQDIALEMLKTKSIELFNALDKLISVINKKDKNNVIKLGLNQKIFLNLIGKVDYIVGNPPWVKWSNLPEGFRIELKKRGFDSLFSEYKNAGGNSLDLYAPIINASAVNYLSKNGTIAMIMPMSLNFNSSLETVRKFNFLEAKQKITKIKDFSSKCNIFKNVSINFGFFIINNSKKLTYIKVDKNKNGLFEENKYPHRNPHTNTIIPFDSKKDFEKTKSFLGIRSESIKVRSGVQFSPNKLRQFYIESENNGIVTLVSSKTKKEQKIGINDIKIRSEKEAISQILRTKDLRDKNSKKHYSWWLYEPGQKQPISLKNFEKKFPILYNNLIGISKYLNPKNDSKFNSRISKAPWYGNIRVGKYTQAPFRIVFSDNGKFLPRLIEDVSIIPEGHVRFIPLYKKSEAKRILKILKKPEIKKLMEIQFLNLNKSFLPKYMYIKL